MSQITTGSTIICGENQAANRIFPVQFGPNPGELATLTVIHKENLRAYEIEVGNCKGTKNYPTAIDWTGTNGTGGPGGIQQLTPNSIELSDLNSAAIECRFQDNSKELDIVSIETTGVDPQGNEIFVDPRLKFTTTP
jgi:hypothetical protein